MGRRMVNYPWVAYCCDRHSWTRMHVAIGAHWLTMILLVVVVPRSGVAPTAGMAGLQRPNFHASSWEASFLLAQVVASLSMLAGHEDKIPEY